MRTLPLPDDPLLFGVSRQASVVAVESGSDGSSMVLYRREGGVTKCEQVAFRPFMLMTSELAAACPVEAERKTLSGEDAPLNVLLLFDSLKVAADARQWAKSQAGEKAQLPIAPFLAVADPVHQFMLTSGCTLFKDMSFGELRRMQVDIECLTSPGYDFCNAEREGDRIIAIAFSDLEGGVEVLSGNGMDEKELLEQFVRRVQDLDPDVIEGHNIFNFDLPYLSTRAARFGVRLALGRDGSEPVKRPSRFNAAERTVSYTRFDIYGRHVIDTLFLAQSYDVSHRSLDSYGLKSVAIHFGVAAEERTYIAGAEISSVYESDPSRLDDYVKDDVIETARIADLLSRSVFAQAQMLPYSYQNIAVRGNAAKIDSLMLREYLRQGRALPLPAPGHPFAGGYTDLFLEGIVKNVHHCDVRSLYPSLMLIHRLGPASDHAGVFLKLLETLRTFRLNVKASMREAVEDSVRLECDALQTTFKILINSFYGYLGFAQARFNDFEAANQVTCEGRELLTQMVMWLEDHGARPIEIDTDGIYYVPPDDAIGGEAKSAFREAFALSLPPGIEIEFDGEFAAMFSYKMKNYALLSHDGEMVIKGAALKSRGIDRYQRDFMRRFIRLRLEGRDSELPALKEMYMRKLEERKLPIDSLAKSEVLSDSLVIYARKRDREGGARRAAYELAIASDRDYQPGDQISYYVTGSKKNVAVHENSRLTSDWDIDNRDENIAYYQSKLETLYDKLGGPKTDVRQGELF